MDQQKIDAAIEARIGKLREQLENEMEKRMQINAIMADMESQMLDAVAWDKVPDDFNDEKIAAALTILYSDPQARTRLNEGFVQDLEERLIPEIYESEPARLHEIIGKVNENLTMTQLPMTMMQPTTLPFIEVMTVPPENEGGEWIIIAAPMEIDDNYEVSVPQKLKFGVRLTMQVAGPGESLTNEFNILLPAANMPAGTAAKPFALPFTPSSDGEKTIVLLGVIDADGRPVKPIVKMVRFHVGPQPFTLAPGWNSGMPPIIDL